MIIINKLKTPLTIALWCLLMVACTPAASVISKTEANLLPVSDQYPPDSLAAATIAPFKTIMTQQMQEVIGFAPKRLEKASIESPLGNFVADAILSQARIHYDDDISFSVVTIGGLRAPIPQGPIKVATIYELMPFENLLVILELTGSQTKALFDLLALNQRMAVSNCVVLVKDDKLHKLFLDGAPFDENRSYMVAISDYLASGGDNLYFLKSAKVLASIDIKIRDMIIDQIKSIHAQGLPVTAEVEGRIKILPGS